MVERLLRDIEEALSVARSVVSLPLDEFLRDVRNRYTLRLALVEIVEAACSIGLHLSREEGRSVEGYLFLVGFLVERGVISAEVGDAFKRLVRLRNLIVHRYWEVDDERIYREASGNGLGVVERFIAEVRRSVLGS